MAEAMRNEKQNIVVMDGDPGADDALGLLLILGSGVRFAGVISSFGNSSSDVTAKNAAKICALAGRSDVPVCQGAAKPLKRTFTPTTLYAGTDGLCDSGLAESPVPPRTGAVEDFLDEISRDAEGGITYLATASLTNLAAALQKRPELRSRITEVVAASGSFGLRKEANRAEWNIEIDPEAAKIVYESGIPIRAVGLDVTAQLQHAYTEELLESLPEGRIRKFLSDCTAYNRKNGLYVSSLLNDSMAAAVILRPELAKFRRGTVSVNPDGVGTEMMSFTEDPAGSVCAAEEYDFQSYLAFLKETLQEMV